MKYLIYLILFFSQISDYFSQHGIVPIAGNNSSGGTISYTGGQLVNFSLSNETGSINAGIQNSQVIETNSIVEISDLFLNVQIYPNPTSDFANLRVTNTVESLLNHSYKIVDVNGKNLYENVFKSTEESIDFSSFKSGVYFIEIQLKDSTYLRLKVVKQ